MSSTKSVNGLIVSVMTPASSPHAATFQQQSRPNQSLPFSKRFKPSKLPLQSVRPASKITLTLLEEEVVVDVVEEEQEEVERVEAEATADAHPASLEHVPIKTSDILGMMMTELPKRMEIKTTATHTDTHRCGNQPSHDSTNCSYPDMHHNNTATAENTKNGCDLYKRLSHKV